MLTLLHLLAFALALVMVAAVLLWLLPRLVVLGALLAYFGVVGFCLVVACRLFGKAEPPR